MEKLVALCVVQLKVTLPLPATRVAERVQEGVVAVMGAVTVTVALPTSHARDEHDAVPPQV